MSDQSSTPSALDNESSLATIVRLVAEGFFSVTPNGEVWRHKKFTKWGVRDVEPRRADPIGPLGYRYVKVTIDGKQISVPAHRLVWHVLKGPIPDGEEVNHTKGNRADNRPEKLELTTSSGNKLHSYRELNHPRKGSPKFSAEKRQEVLDLRAAGLSFLKIEKATGVSAAAARAICGRQP